MLLVSNQLSPKLVVWRHKLSQVAVKDQFVVHPLSLSDALPA